MLLEDPETEGALMVRTCRERRSSSVTDCQARSPDGPKRADTAVDAVRRGRFEDCRRYDGRVGVLIGGRG